MSKTGMAPTRCVPLSAFAVYAAFTNTRLTQLQKKLTTDEFRARALPLHVQLTHTPPSIRQEGNVNEDGSEEHASAQIGGGEADVGAIGNLTLVPSTFSTGSYGWKGSKRIVVELQAGEEDAEGHREKVQVMLS
jgi:hypothetical protein